MKAPEFSLRDEQGQPFVLSEQLLNGPLLVVFYPGDNTPVCTAQLCDYSAGMDDFTALGVRVVGISRDDAQSHQSFKAKHDLKMPLLSDEDGDVAKAFGVGGGLLGPKRAVFLIDQVGEIRYQHVEAVAVFRRQTAELLAAIEQAIN